MNKRYITSQVINIAGKNGKTIVDVKWTIDFSRLPNMVFLLDFLSNVLTEKDFNDIDPTLEYWNHRYYTFITTASSRVSEKDTYNEDIGYRIAFLRNRKKAIYTYNKLISVINSKINKYFKEPLEGIKTNNSFDILDSRLELNKYYFKIFG